MGRSGTWSFFFSLKMFFCRNEMDDFHWEFAPLEMFCYDLRNMLSS